MYPSAKDPEAKVEPETVAVKEPSLPAVLSEQSAEQTAGLPFVHLTH
jgi:hypothetical protein